MLEFVVCPLLVNRPVRTRMLGGVGIAPWKRMKFSNLRWLPW